jgi:hypothetical protein
MSSLEKQKFYLSLPFWCIFSRNINTACFAIIKLKGVKGAVTNRNRSGFVQSTLVGTTEKFFFPYKKIAHTAQRELSNSRNRNTANFSMLY